MFSNCRRRLTRRLTAACAVIGVLALTACTASVAGSAVAGGGGGAQSGGGQITVPGGSTSGGSSAASSKAGPVPTGLDKYYSQQLSWGGCVSYATNSDDKQYYSKAGLQCARLTVPLAYDDPTGPTITVGVLRAKSTGSGSDRIGSLLFNPGGPGGSGMSLVAQIASYGIAPDLQQHFDLVGFDPRGIGSSEPTVVCQTDAERDKTRATDVRTSTQAEVDAANKALKDIVANCVARTGKDQGIDGKTFLANVGTRDAARDMDVLRAALGDSKLSYVGYSYGTRLGYVYAEQFPTNVRAMILDGAVAPNSDPATSLLGQAKGFQDAFNDFATWCSQQSNCPLGADPAAATSTWQQLSRPLLTTQLKLSDSRVLSYGDANTGIIDALYSDSDSERQTLLAALQTFKSGNGTKLMALADEYYERGDDGAYSSLTDPFNAIRCVDDPAMTDPMEVTKLNAQYAQAAPFQDSGDPAGAVMDICAFWPVDPTLTPHTLDISNLSATLLVVSTTGDPATPYQDGVELAKELKASLLTVDGTRHTSYLLSGITCADDIGNAYLIDLTDPPADKTCS